MKIILARHGRGKDVQSDAHIAQSDHDLIEDAGGSGMRHFELRDGLTEILDQGLKVGGVLRFLQSGLDAGDQGIETLPDLGLFGLQALELRAQFIQGLT